MYSYFAHSNMFFQFPGKSPLRDIVSVSKTFEKRKSGEMISREESPKWNTIDSRCSDYRDIDKLPS